MQFYVYLETMRHGYFPASHNKFLPDLLILAHIYIDVNSVFSPKP